VSDAYRAALRAARAGSAAAAQIMAGTTATVRENLRLVFGHADSELVRATYRHFAAMAVDLTFYRRVFDPARFEAHFSFVGDGLEHHRAAGGGAAVFATGHFGNWELFGGAFHHVGIQLAPVARPPGEGWFARRIDRFRRAQGQELIPKDNALPLAMKALKRGKCVAFLMDQAAGRNGVAVPFFGRPAWTFIAPAALALKLGVPLYAGYSTRLGDGIRYRCFAEHVPFDAGEDAIALTARLNGILEGYVRACPEQWWWFHKRFKPPRAERRGRPLSAAGVPLEAPVA